MEIVDFDSMLYSILTGTKEEAAKIIKTYGDCRAKAGIDEAWTKANKLLKVATCNREKRMKDFILNYDLEAGAITLIGFTRYYAALEELLKKLSESASRETKDALSDVADGMQMLLGDVKIDKRIVYSKS